MRRLIASLGVLFALTACASTPIDGTVTAKHYRPAYDTVEQVPMYGTRCTTEYNPTTKTTSQNCTQYIQYWYPQTVHHGDCHQLVVEQDGGDQDGKARSTCVHKAVWDSVHVGSHYAEGDS